MPTTSEPIPGIGRYSRYEERQVRCEDAQREQVGAEIGEPAVRPLGDERMMRRNHDLSVVLGRRLEGCNERVAHILLLRIGTAGRVSEVLGLPACCVRDSRNHCVSSAIDVA